MINPNNFKTIKQLLKSWLSKITEINQICNKHIYFMDNGVK
jgi:hypothetical protein